ncbi:CsgG/HfaB family protein [Aureimonas mangrovi]|uniref:CsgG/HfaB family protein n=1 Tax=Aureimonas mangrovi TaxID=2758041 RepID=UPI00163DE60E|nr:CsgG/HfaB family protein [Aureimonas mangrovi]
MTVRKTIATLLTLSLLAGCAGAPGVAGSTSNAKLVQGPPITDIVTPFDKALSCLKGEIQPSIVFSVGAVIDQTGKESFTDGGVGKFVTQGAGDMIQSALFKAGTTVVNRRDPRVMTTEVEWQIRDPRRIVPSNFYITGSINSLDFIPGSGAEVDIAGIAGRYRQNRMLVGLDLAMTDANTGRIVANVPLHKQIFASEAGLGTGRFFGDTLVLADIGGREREAIHFALRQMLYLATFELLTQVMSPTNYAECRGHIDRAHGYVDNTTTAAAVAAVKLPPPPQRTASAVSGPQPAGRQASASGMARAAQTAAASPASRQQNGNFAASSGTFAPSNGGDEDTSAQARAQAILTAQ